MSDYYSIQEVGGAELTWHYRDRGPIADSDYHRAMLVARKGAREGWRRLFAKRERFLAVLSANNHGLRVFVALDKFAVFIPWSQVTVSAERSTPGTIVRLQTAAVPLLDLTFHLDDAAADDLFESVMAPLPKRDPPGRIYCPKPWAVAAAVLLSFAICIFWRVCRPIFEEHRPLSSSKTTK
jgi:hypothetical protein